MPVFDFECKRCNHIHEAITPISKEEMPCPACGAPSKRIISGSYRKNDNAGWLKDVLPVVDKESHNPHTREFLKNPTRSNYRAWMKANNLRHFEPGEEKTRPPEPNHEKIQKEMWNGLQKRRRIEVG